MKLVYLACLIMENVLKRLDFPVKPSLYPIAFELVSGAHFITNMGVDPIYVLESLMVATGWIISISVELFFKKKYNYTWNT